MTGNFKKEDLRITKTYRALVGSMRVLLSRRKFDKITVNDLCDEALISRVTFYAHFSDKYDLLKYCLADMKKEIMENARAQGDMMRAVNHFIDNNTSIVTNLVDGANHELSGLLHDFMYSIVCIAILKNNGGDLSENQVLLSNFCAGGMVNLLRLRVESKTSPPAHVINAYFFELLESIVKWDAGLSQRK